MSERSSSIMNPEKMIVSTPVMMKATRQPAQQQTRKVRFFFEGAGLPSAAAGAA